jgi:hypothetical protein
MAPVEGMVRVSLYAEDLSIPYMNLYSAIGMAESA